MVRADSDFQFSKMSFAANGLTAKLVLSLATNIEGMDGTSNVIRRIKGSATKTPVSCPNITKMYNSSMDGVDVIDQKTAPSRLDHKRKFRFYLTMLFDIAIMNSHIVYTKLGNSISLLYFKIVVAKSLIARYSNRQRSFPLNRKSKRKTLASSLPKEIPTQMPEFNEKRMQCSFCKNEGTNHKTFVPCPTCSLYLCYTKERNCSLKQHV